MWLWHRTAIALTLMQSALQARFGDIEVVALLLHRVLTASSLHPGMALQIGSVIVEPTTDGETRA